MQRSFYRKLTKKGFTLIELIVVIAILGILILIAVPRLGAFRERALATTNEANLRIMQGAGAMWLAENGNPAANTQWTASSNTDQWGKYLEKWPSGINSFTISTLGAFTWDAPGVTGSGSGGTTTIAVTDRYEAEGGVLNGCNVANDSAASNNQKVGWFDTVNDSIRINGIDGGVGGPASIVIRYSIDAATNTNRTVSLYVNDTTTRVHRVTLAGTTSWSIFAASAPLQIELNAGNTNFIVVRVDSGDGVIDFDCFDVTVMKQQ